MTTRSWSTATKNEQKCAKSLFRIPQNIKRVLFPDRHHSIWQMLNFAFPPITSIHSASPNYTQFFCHETPFEMTPDLLHKLRTLPLPNSTAIKQLNTLSREHWMNGAKSVLYVHTSGEETRFPLWVISYWTVVLTTYHKIRHPWLQNLGWINEQRNQFSNVILRSEAEDVFQLFANLSWTSPKMGFADQLPLHTLWRIMGKNWWDSTTIDNALEVVRSGVEGSPELREKVIVCSTDVLEKVVQLFGEDDGRLDEYWEKCGWLAAIAKKVFEEGKTLVSIAHLGRLPPRKGETVGLNHWVPLAIDGAGSRFLYADSLCGKKDPVMPPRLSKALGEWKSLHTFAQFTNETMAISAQNDNHSCGPCAVNALEHFICPGIVDLVRPNRITNMRLQTMSKILLRIKEMVSHVHILN